MLKNNCKIFFGSIIILRFVETKVGEEEFYGSKNAIKTWDNDDNNIVISDIKQF